jgi:competence protein ComEA
MQANLKSRIVNFLKAAESLSRQQRAIIAALLVLLCAGSVVAYVRSRPRAIAIKDEATAGRAATRTLTVHVAGAVVAPGLYKVPEGSRVADALQRAGGPAPDASLDDLNLAGKVQDGQKVMVPRRPPPGSPLQAGVPATPASNITNLNTASAADLDKLPGVGPSMAQRIIDYRTKNGTFSSVEDLDNVEGIGPKKLEDLRDLVTI